MSILTKESLAASEGSPGVPAVPGYFDPGTPAVSPKPAYCIDEHVGSTILYTYVTLTDPVTGKPYTAPIPSGTTPSVIHHCYPATPGSPGTPGHYVEGTPGIPPVPPSPANFQIGWNASARSIDSLTGDGQYEFSISPDAVGIVTGLNDADGGSAYIDIDHAMYFASGRYDIIESGTKLGVTGSFTATDVFTIARIGTQVRYWKNSTLLYTSTVASSGTVFADASMYFGGDKITDASLTGTVASGFTGNTGALTGILSGLKGAFSDSDAAYTPAGVPPETGTVDATGDWPGRSGDQLRMMTSSFISDGSLTGDLVGVLTGLSGFFSENDVAEFNPVLTPLTAVFVGDGGYTMLLGTLTPLTAEFVADDVQASMTGVLTGFQAYLESGLLEPEFAVLPLYLQTMTSFSIALAGMAGVLTGVLGGLRGFASNAPNAGYMQAGLPFNPTTMVVDPLTGDWGERSGDQLRMMTMLALDQEAFENTLIYAHGEIVLPALQIKGRINAGNTLRGNLILPHPLLAHMEFGWAGDLALPMLTCDIGMTVGNVLRAALTLPMLEASGGGVVGTVFGTTEGYPLPLPPLGMAGHISTPGTGLVTLPALASSGRIVTHHMLQAEIRLPRLRASGEILTPLSPGAQIGSGRVLSGHLVLPPLQPVKSAYGSILLPSLRASGYVPVILGGQTGETRIGYAMNLKNAAVTEFTEFPFKAMARAHSRYWGVGMDGKLYRFGGDLDDTAKIAWEWRSGQADFGVWGQKAVLAVYIRGIFENGATVTFVSDDATRVYDHVFAGNYNDYKVHRVALGRGVRTDSMAFGMASAVGGYLELDKVTPEYRITPRNL